MANYITSTQLREYIGSESANFQTVIDQVVTVVSRTIEQVCERTFFADSTVSTQYYWPDSWWSTPVDDIWTTSGLIVTTDDTGAGNYTTTWTLDTDFFLEPINQRRGGITGWPYDSMTALLSRAFVRGTQFQFRRPPVKVVAKYGWAEVPDNIVQAALVGGAYLYKLKDAADGFVGISGWGPTRVKENPAFNDLLGPFKKNAVVVA